MPTISSSNLQVNQPIEASAPDSSLTITIDSNQPIAVGSHTFQLEVIDDSGNRSQPATFRVIVIDDQVPTAIIDGPERVPFGQEIILSGSRSTDAGGGSIVKFIWTLIQ